jgi:hypothetical protein
LFEEFELENPVDGTFGCLVEPKIPGFEAKFGGLFDEFELDNPVDETF